MYSQDCQHTMTTPVNIRPISQADLAAYRILRLEALQSHPEAFGTDYAEQAADPESAWVDRIRGSIDGTMSRLFLAEAPDALAGMAGVYRDRGVKVQHSATLVSVYVRPPYRGRKIGDRLIQEVVQWCASVNVRKLRLAVATTNESAIRCYQRCGFSVYGQEPEVIRVGERYIDELLMQRRV
jgi:ribosomal protein S18 acetylase RimI-like enzyme